MQAARACLQAHLARPAKQARWTTAGHLFFCYGPRQYGLLAHAHSQNPQNPAKACYRCACECDSASAAATISLSRNLLPSGSRNLRPSPLSATAAPPASMAEMAVVAPMPVLEKPIDSPATAPANKKPPSSSNAKKRKGKLPDPVPATEAPVAKRKGKGPPNPAPAAEAPVAKKPKTGDARTPAAEPPRSGIAVAHTAVPAPMSTLPVLQDADADGQTPQQSQLHGTKRKRPPSATKHFKPPMAKKLSPVVTRSPMMRLVVSPLAVRPRSPSLSPRRSPSHSPRRSPSRSPRRSPARSPRRSPARSPRSGAAHSGSHDHGKPRKLRSTIWKDMDPIYQDWLHGTRLAGSAFSTSGRIINDHRTRLAGSTVEALLCFQDWLRTAGSSYLDIISIDSLDSSSNDLYQ